MIRKHIGEGQLDTALLSSVFESATMLLVEGTESTDHAAELACDLFDTTVAELVRRTNKRIDKLNDEAAHTVAGGVS